MRLPPLLALLFLAACAPDPGEGKTDAVVTEAVPPAPAAPTAPSAPIAAAPTGAGIAIDPARSKLHALGAKITRTHEINFDQWSGNLRMDGQNLTGLDVTVQVASLRADVEKLTNHLKSPDFFSADAFPTATFVSTSVVAAPGANGATHTVEGDLTMHGVTQHLSFPATVAVANNAVDAKAEFAINRQDFGIKYPGMPDDLIQDKVLLTVELVADLPKP